MVRGTAAHRKQPIPGDNDPRPTAEEFADPAIWKPYRSFVLGTVDERPGCVAADLTFHRGDFVRIKAQESEVKKEKAKLAKIPKLSNGASAGGSKKEEEENHDWIARIERIKGKNAESVYIHVRWCYTAAQMRAIELPVPPETLPNEIFFSHHVELQEVQTVDERIPVLPFDTSLPFLPAELSPIDPTDLFYRGTLVFNAEQEAQENVSRSQRKEVGGKGKRKKFEPYVVPLSDPTCTCDQPYHISPTAASSRMVYCTNGCSRWYHLSCLPPPSAGTIDEIIHLQTTGLSLPGLPEPDLTGLDSLGKQAMLKLARGSIVRGGREGMVGNGREVLEARRVVASWGRKERESMVKSSGVGVAHWMCPECNAIC